MPSNINDPGSWRLSVVSAFSEAIPYRLVSQNGGYSPEKGGASETYIIQASRLRDFAQAVLPKTVDNGAGDLEYHGGRLFPGSDRLRTKSFNWKSFQTSLPVDPWGADSDADDGTYSELLALDITYETSKRENDKDTDVKTILEISADIAGEYLSIHGKGKWIISEGAEDKNKDVLVPIAKLIPQTEWTVTWPHVPWQWGVTVLIPSLQVLIGKVNIEKMELPPINAPIETLLFLGFSFREERQWNEATGFPELPPFSLDLKFLEKRVPDLNVFGAIGGHNHHWRPEKGKFEKWVFNEGDNPANNEFTYEAVDLNQIFGLKAKPPKPPAGAPDKERDEDREDRQDAIVDEKHWLLDAELHPGLHPDVA